MKKYLVISTVGDESLHHEWVQGTPNFDLVLLYYGNNEEVAIEYSKQTPHVYAAKGEKYHLLKSLITSSPEFISQYSHIWMPDNDVSISTDEINRLFEYVSRLKTELSEGEGGLKYKIHTEKALAKIKEMVSELNQNIKRFK